MDRHVVVTGLMGVGKSTTARLAAQALERSWFDSDADLETLFGVSGRSLARDQGVDELHRVESAAVLGRLLSEPAAVIAAAASVVLDPLVRRALRRRAFVVVLDAPVDEVLRRAASGAHRRPMDRAELESIHRHRSPLFDELADLRLDARQQPEIIVEQLVRAVDAETPTS